MFPETSAPSAAAPSNTNNSEPSSRHKFEDLDAPVLPLTPLVATNQQQVNLLGDLFDEQMLKVYVAVYQQTWEACENFQSSENRSRATPRLEQVRGP